MEKIIIKNAQNNIQKELESIEFDLSYIIPASKKYAGRAFKLFYLKPHEANILKQICLSLGFDCAVSRNTVMCNCEFTNCLIFATNAQFDKLIEKLKKQPFRLKDVASLLEMQIETSLLPLNIRNNIFDWTKPYIMGILNVTPDSFSDGGEFVSKDSALKQALKMIQDGADIIDIGGESTRPDAKVISPDEEIKRVIPSIEALRKEDCNITISIDTRNYQTAKAAIEAGADIINDVSGFDYDEKLKSYACSNNIPSVIMHSDSVPAISKDFTQSDIVEDIYFSLNSKIEELISNGLNRSNIIADTGIGFGKSKEGCFEILKRHGEFTSLNVPLLLGISRKSFIRNTFDINCEQADIPTALYSALSLSKGVNIHRVHNVALVKKYLDFAKFI